MTRNFKKDDAHVDAQADASPYVHVNFIRHAVGIISDARKGAAVFGNERGNIVTRGETASFAEGDGRVLTVDIYARRTRKKEDRNGDLK